MALSPIIYNHGLMPICWTRAARSRLLVLAAPVFLVALGARVARGPGASSSALWEAWPHTVPVSPFALKHEGMRAELAALLARHGLLDGVVARYLDCGIFERGFARIRCPDCAAEFLLAFSCKGRDLCPSCGAKRAAEFAALLKDEVVADVGHAQWVFTVPKLLRPYFMHHRELLGPLCTAAWQTVRELMAVAAGEEQDFRPGMVAMSQTFGDQLNLHPHVHALVTRGGWTASGEWVPVPYVDPSAAEQLFRHKVIRLLQREGLLDEDRTRLLLSWHHSGFSVHNAVTIPAGDGRALEALARLRWEPGSETAT